MQYKTAVNGGFVFTVDISCVLGRQKYTFLHPLGAQKWLFKL
jgi:hypothetical protein